MDKYCSKCGGKLVQGLYSIRGTLNDSTIDDKAIGYKCQSCGSVQFEDSIIHKILLKNKSNIVSEFIPVMINNIGQIIEESELSRGEIAKALGVTEQRISNIINNDNIPLVLTALQLAYLLDVQYEELYTIKYISPEQYYNLCTYNTDFNQVKELVPVYNKLYDNKILSNSNKLTKEKQKELKAEKKALTEKATEIKESLDYDYIIRKGNSMLKSNWQKAIELGLITGDNE